MKKRLRALLTLSSLVAVILFSPAPAQAQSAIFGRVLGDDGKPLAGAVVNLDRIDIETHFEVETDNKGRYFLTGLRPAFYKVTLTLDGQPVAHYEQFRVKLGNENELNFDLAEIRRLAIAQMSNEEREAMEKERARREAAEEKFKDMTAAFDAGRELFAAKKYEEASIAFLKASEIDPSQHVILSNLAVSYQRLKKYDQALESYEKALALLYTDPDPKAESVYYFNIGILQGQKGKIKLAVEAMEKAAKLDPDRASQAFYNLGIVLTNSGQSSDATQAFKKAIEANPENANAHYQLGINLVAMAEVTPDGKTVPAPGTIEAFEKYLKIQPDGRYAAQAKGMIQTLSASVKTEFSAGGRK